MWRRIDGADERCARWCRWLTIGTGMLFLLLVTRWHPWRVFDRTGFTNDFYAAQARAMVHLRLDVPPSVAGPEGFDIDGTTYVYFGPLLSLVRIPFLLFGHGFDTRLTRISMLVGFVAFCTAAHHLALEARRLVTARRPDRSTERDHARVAAFVAACAVSPALVLAGWTSVYHETEMWGATFCAWTLVHAVRFAHSPTRRDGVLTAVLASLALLTRATMGFGAAFAAGLVSLLVIAAHRREPGGRREQRLAIGVIGATTVGALGHFVTTYVKLGSLVEMPWLQQHLTTVSTTRQAWFAGNGNSFFGTTFLPTTLLQYLRPDAIRFERLVPFIRFGPLASDVGGYPLETNTPTSSLTVTATVLVVLAVAGCWLLVRWRAWSWVAVLAGAALAALPSFLIGFVAVRYLADMMPMLMVPAAVGALALHLPSRLAARRTVTMGLAGLLLWGMWSNTAFATWIDQLKNPGFTALRYSLDAHLFGNPAPSIVLLDAANPTAHMPHDGSVAIRLGPDGATCDGVYIAEQGAWAVLERTNGALRLTGSLTLTGEVTAVAGSDTWTIDATMVDGSVQFSVEGDGIPAAIGAGDDGMAAVASDEPIDVTIVADQVTHELSVSAGGDIVLFSFAVPTGSMVAYDSFAVDADPGDSLCTQLIARR